MSEIFTQPKSFDGMESQTIVHDTRPVMPESKLETETETKMRLRIETLLTAILNADHEGDIISNAENSAVFELSQMQIYMKDFHTQLVSESQTPHEIALDLMRQKRTRESLN